MLVKDLMSTKIVTIDKDTLYEEAAKILYDNKLTGAPVVDDGKIIGFVSEKDLFRVLFPFYRNYYKHPESYTDNEDRESKANEIRKHKIERFMKSNVLTIRPNLPVLSAGALMLANGIHRLPVVDNGNLIGIIDRQTIYKNIFKTQLFDKK
jgi:CBS domain-containing protein